MRVRFVQLISEISKNNKLILLSSTRHKTTFLTIVGVSKSKIKQQLVADITNIERLVKRSEQKGVYDLDMIKSELTDMSGWKHL